MRKETIPYCQQIYAGREAGGFAINNSKEVASEA
jgi:hypothetical protein